ncbi:hypothetical protein [Hymenobacter sp. B81]|uniref:hypothetical protein n=1 Tax=Hymenobacter sp. B81 TaxID=3344878 RepID=UPI0037DC8DF1
MLRHSEYIALLRNLATRHVSIGHTPAASRFARIVVSIDPLQRVVDLHEFTNNVLGARLKPALGQQVLVVESCQTDYLDNGGDNRTRLRHAAFMVLQQVKANDHDAVEAALDATEETAEDLIGGIEFLLADQVKVRIQPNSLGSDSIGPLGDGTWYGTRMDFDFTTPATAALAYKPYKFLL